MAAASIQLHKGDLPADVGFGTAIAIDTETLGLRPLRDRLCLVQLSAGDQTAHLVQIAADRAPAPRLCAMLENDAVQKIFHFARFDVAILKHNLGVNIRNVYCTKIASKLVRTYTDRHGLKDLVAELLGTDLSKQQQSSDWAADILSPEQLEYAAADVLYLHALKGRLDAMLLRQGRADLAASCFKFLETRAALDLAGFEDTDIFAH